MRGFLLAPPAGEDNVLKENALYVKCKTLVNLESRGF